MRAVLCVAPEKTNKEDTQTVPIKHPQSLFLPKLKEDGQRSPHHMELGLVGSGWYLCHHLFTG